MSNARPRRALPSERRRVIPIIVAVALVIGGAVVGGAWWLSRSAPDTAGSTVPPPAPRAACAHPAEIVVDPAYGEAFTALAAAQGAATGCAPLTVHTADTAAVAADGLGSAAGWVPAAESVPATMEPKTDLAGAAATFVAQSPIVLVTPSEAAGLLGAGQPTGELLTGLMLGVRSWSDFGKPEWGKFGLVAPDPTQDAAGALGVTALMHAVTGGQPIPSDLAVATPEQRRVAVVEQQIVELVARPADVFDHLAASSATPGHSGPRTGLTTEHALAQHLAAQTGARLSAVYAPGGASVRLSVLNPNANQAVEDFALWLGTSEGKAELGKVGLRAADNTTFPDTVKSAGLVPAEAKPSPEATAVAQISLAGQVFAATRLRTSTLTVIDVSGSMGATFPGTNQRRVDLISQAAVGSFELFPPGTRTGLMTFNAVQGRPNIRVVLPLTENNSPEWAAIGPQFQQMLGRIPVGGGTPLYQAIKEGYSYAHGQYDESRVNRVIVLTDGKEEAARGVINETQLIEQVKAMQADGKKIAIILVGIGPEADGASLERIATATGGSFVWVRDIAEFPAVAGAALYPRL